MEETDPYAPPASVNDLDDLALASQHTLRELVKAWEKRRLLYNLIMLPPGILILVLFVFRQNMPIPAAIAMGLASGTGANAAFFLGPLAELYIRGWFMNGKEAPGFRKLLFAGGLFISLGLTLVFIVIAAFGN